MLQEQKVFALVCWLLWGALIVAGASGATPWPLAAAMAVSIYVLWRLYRRRATAHA